MERRELISGVILFLLFNHGCCIEKSFSENSFSANLPGQSNMSEAESLTRCAGECIAQEECVGFCFDATHNLCGVFGCFNPEPAGNVKKGDKFKTFTMEVDHHLAQGKPVSLSSVRSEHKNSIPYFGAFAVDGIYSPPAGQEKLSIAHTERETNPWLRVDLQRVHCIWAVRILNRGESHTGIAERLKDVIVTASILELDISRDTDLRFVCAEQSGILNRFFTTLACQHPMRAQFVQLTVKGKEFLNIYEFEVHGFKNV